PIKAQFVSRLVSPESLSLSLSRFVFANPWKNPKSTSMATSIARFSRRALTPNPIRRFFATSAALATNAEAPKPKLTVSPSPSPDRVKWDYRGQRQIIPLGQWLPKVAVDAYVAPNVVLAGQVTVWDGSSVWNGAVLRGDLNKITLGFCANVQERCVVHAAWSSPTGCCSLIVTNIVFVIGNEDSLLTLCVSLKVYLSIRTLTNEETLEIPKLAVAINHLSGDYFSEFLPYSTVYLEVEKFKKSLGIAV
ncbi:hypothetical protein F2Q70_00018931, partial [Brassica cretica]